MKNNITKPIIIIGSGRSGTTVISEILFRHETLAWPSNYQEMFPAMAGINLIRLLFDNKLWRLQGQKPQLNKVSSLNKMLFKPAEAYKFWEHLTGPEIDFSRGFLIDDKPSDADVNRIRKTFRKLVKYQFKKRLAFKITGPSRIGYLKSIFPDAVFINIVRDPLPTISSWLNVDFWQDKGKNQLWWTGAYTPQEEDWSVKNADKPELLAAMQYRKLMDVTEKEITTHNANVLTVRYEDFVNDPVAEVKRMMDFAGLEKSPMVDAYMQGIKIYNQNRNEDKPAPLQTDMQRILQGAYAF